MSPGATTRGLSLCYALLVNSAAGTIRRASVLATPATASQTTSAGHSSYHRHHNRRPCVKIPHDCTWWDICRRHTTTAPTAVGFAVNTAMGSGVGVHTNRSMKFEKRSTSQAARKILHRSGAAPFTSPRSRIHTGHDIPYVRRARSVIARMSTSQIDNGSPVSTSGKGGVRGLSATDQGGSAEDEKILKVTLLSGFLGAGKTTLMRNVLRQAREENLSLAVIVNDMADVNIDAQMLATEERVGSGSDVRSVGDRDSGDGGRAAVAMQDGCICCTLRDDLLMEVEAVARSGRHDHLIIESTGISDPTPVAEAFAAAGVDPKYVDINTEAEREGGLFALDTLVTVVDSTSFLDEVRKADDLEERGLEAEEGDTRTIADLLVSQVEFANVVLLNKSDLVAKPEDMITLEAVVRQLNPAARVMRTVSSSVGLKEVLGTGEFDLEEASQAAGWVQALNEETPTDTHNDHDHEHTSGGHEHHSSDHSHAHAHVHGPDCAADCTLGTDSVSSSSTTGRSDRETFGIGSFTFRARRPFHPERLMDFVMEHLPSVLRSKGFLWLATRHDTAGVWNQAGGSFATEYGGSWAGDIDVDIDNNVRETDSPSTGTGDGSSGEQFSSDSSEGDNYSHEDNTPRNELVFIGLLLDMKEDVLRSELNRCLLTDEEMKGGAREWSRDMVDPFPAWTAEGLEEEEEVEEEEMATSPQQ